MQKYDVIVIGSGIGGLTIASALSLMNKKVLVLEKHPFLGGLTRSFRRKDWIFNTGLHVHQWPTIDTEKYKRIWNILGGERVPWAPASTVYHHGKETLELSTNADYTTRLISKFPSEEMLIRKYIKDVESVDHDFESYCSAMSLRGWAVGRVVDFVLGRLVKRYDTMPLVKYLDELGVSPALRNALTFYWDNYGLPPSESSFAAHAIYTSSLIRGGWVPQKPVSQISYGFISKIRKNGGTVIGGAGISEFLYTGKQVNGVRTSDGREFFAPIVFSSIGAVETNRILPPEFQYSEAKEWRKINSSFFMVNYGLKNQGNPFPVGGSWLYNAEYSDQVDKPIWRDIRNDAIPYTGAFRIHDNTLQCMTVVDATQFNIYQNSSSRNRSSEYTELLEIGKKKMDKLLACYYPNFHELVEFTDVSSPLTIRDYTNHENGTCYGIGSAVGRYNLKQVTPAAPLRGVYLCGQDLCTPGVVGGFLGSIISLAALFKRDVASSILQMEEKA